MESSAKMIVDRRVSENNVWLRLPQEQRATTPSGAIFRYNVLENEQAVGEAMLNELIGYALSLIHI